MSSPLYPSLEDMKVDQMIKAQQRPPIEPLHHYANTGSSAAPPSAPYPTLGSSTTSAIGSPIYPELNEWMGMDLTSQEVAAIKKYAVVAPNNTAVAISTPTTVVGTTQMLAPVSGTSVGLLRANVTHGVREVVVCKDESSKIGLRVKDINKGIFVVFVQNGTPAAMVGLRFGDQILQINGENVAGFSTDKVHDIIKKCGVNGIHLVVRDRPFERVITLHKDSAGHCGFTFKNGRINAIVKDSSAARNGLLTEHNFLEINGQNVVGVDDKEIRSLMESSGSVITLTIMPSIIFDHMMKQMSTSLVKKLMDHSIPNV
ncbi:syntenin-1-like [Oppia nitens]|uniref:syntenin-1-like n=1 Tax=Oppia nitens TaxID=1686743 RepID=UPI0023DCB0E3|nr:syntenin-1-like [Oppia nitens]